jgi:hypothetical protein
MPRVSPTDALISGRSPRPRVRLYQQWRHDPVTGRARLSKNFVMSWTDPTTGESRTRSTRTADRAEAEAIAKTLEAQLGEPRPGRSTPR